MPIKRLYHKLTAETVPTDAAGFDSDTLDKRKKSVDVKGQRLQLIVYSALFAFIILAAYGYYLIFNLTHDVHSMSNDVRQMSHAVNNMSRSVIVNMDVISDSIVKMQSSTQLMSRVVADTLPEMTKNTTIMTKTAQNVNNRINDISADIQIMSMSMVAMQHDMWSMNDTFSNPVESIFNNMMPWNNRKQGSQGPLPFRQQPIR